MLWFPLLLVTMALAAEEERIIDDYIVKIKDDTLTNVQPTEKSSDVLDLSGLGLRDLEKDAFDNLSNLKTLSLRNNSLSSVPRGIFSKLENLEHLILANNNISEFAVAFAGLDRLKSLNISHNPVKKLRYSEFFGLPKSSVVFTEGLNLQSINMNVFEKATEDFDVLDEDRAEEMHSKFSELFKRNAQCRTVGETDGYMLKVCIEDGVLKQVEKLEETEELPSNCRAVKFRGILALNNMGISKFEKNWYRLSPDLPVILLNLTGNEIVEVTSEMLNDLPAKIYDVHLSRNKIKRLEKNVIRNPHITMLHLDSNDISEIADGAFEGTDLQELYLSGNRLEDTKFARTLPKVIYKLDLRDNKIPEISACSFLGLDQLFYLFLGGNLIQELKADSLIGLTNLFLLGLFNNRLSKLESGCFRHTPTLHILILTNNNITSFENGAFDGLEKLSTLDVSGNNLTSIKDDFPNGLPVDLSVLNCGSNKLEKLEQGTFKNVPRYQLILDGNQISKIEHGAFDLPELTKLILDKNNLTELDGDSFQGLNELKRLSLIDNGTARIPKGFGKHFADLRDLDLRLNPIKSLENGAFYGLKKAKPIYPNLIYLEQVPVEVIEGGLFDDM